MEPAITSRESANELYAPLPPEIVELLRQCESTAMLKAGMPLITHGEDPERLVIVCSGEVRLSLPSQGDPVFLGTAGPGKVLGLRCLISGERPDIDAFCMSDCRVTVISKSRFMDLVKSHPEIYFAIAKVLSSDLELAEHHLKTTSRAYARRVRKNSC